MTTGYAPQRGAAEAAAQGVGLGAEVRRVCLLREADGSLCGYAVADGAGGAEITAGGWPLLLVSPQSPIGAALLCLPLGDELCVQTPGGLCGGTLVAVDGGPVLSPEECAALQQTRQRERERDRAEQQEATRQARCKQIAQAKCAQTLADLKIRRKEAEAKARAEDAERRTRP